MQETHAWFLGWEDTLEKEWQPAPVFLPGKSHRRRSLAGYSPWDPKESDMTEQLTLALLTAFLHSLDLINMSNKCQMSIYLKILIRSFFFFLNYLAPGFPDSSVGKESTSNVGDLGSIPGLGRSPGEGNPPRVHGVAKSWVRLTHTSTWAEYNKRNSLLSFVIQRSTSLGQSSNQ